MNSMEERNLLLLSLLALFIFTEAKCPSYCSCYHDLKGRQAVECKKGGLSGPLSLNDMELSTEVLKVSAPEDNLNALTMNPNIQSFTNLEEIHITKSNVPNLGQRFFYGLKKLYILDLSENNITQILDLNFAGLTRLQELHLDDNKIYSLPSGTFRHLNELKILSVQRNRLTEMVPSIFQQLDRLQVLKLSGNALDQLNPEVFKDVKNLRVLECRGCKLHSVDSQIYELIPHLIHLDLGDNEFRHLSSNEFDRLPKLRSLKLDGNRLAAITGPSFAHLRELRKLTLAKNHLTEISSRTFENLTNLTELDIGYNKLETMNRDVLKPIQTTLEALIISGNHIPPSEIGELVKNLMNIKNLQAAECQLFDFEENFVPDKLTHLNLAGNSLHKLPVDAVPYTLIEIDLSRNKFKGLTDEIIQRLEGTPKIKLDYNPWSCDLCNIFPLLSRVNKSETFYNLKCSSPHHHKGKILGTLRKEDLNWCSIPMYHPTDANLYYLGDENKVGIIAAGASVVLLVLTVLGILGALLYTRRHAAKYYTHEEKRSPERESIFENQGQLFGDDRELSFKFPLDAPEKKIATIDEIKKEYDLANGT